MSRYSRLLPVPGKSTCIASSLTPQESRQAGQEVPVRLGGHECLATPSKRAMRSSCGGWGLKNETNLEALKGLTMNMWAVAWLPGCVGILPDLR